jgi:hypothetical protein
MGGMIPMKLCIFERADGQTYISMMDTRQMRHMFREPVIRENLRQAAEELDKLLADIITER